MPKGTLLDYDLLSQSTQCLILDILLNDQPDDNNDVTVNVVDLINLSQILGEFDPTGPNIKGGSIHVYIERLREARALSPENYSLPSESKSKPQMQPKVGNKREFKKPPPGCWNCGDKDHRYPACPETFTKRFCFHCELLGCISRDCPDCRWFYK